MRQRQPGLPHDAVLYPCSELPNRGVAVYSEVLGLELRDEREARLVRLHDPETGEDLLTYEETDRAREGEAVARRQEAALRREAEVRAAALEARLRALEDGVSPPEGERTRKPAQ